MCQRKSKIQCLWQSRTSAIWHWSNQNKKLVKLVSKKKKLNYRSCFCLNVLYVQNKSTIPNYILDTVAECCFWPREYKTDTMTMAVVEHKLCI